MTDLSLEGVLQAKQFDKLAALPGLHGRLRIDTVYKVATKLYLKNIWISRISLRIKRTDYHWTTFRKSLNKEWKMEAGEDEGCMKLSLQLVQDTTSKLLLDTNPDHRSDDTLRCIF